MCLVFLKVKKYKFSILYTYSIFFIERQKKCSRYLALGPGARKNLSVIKSHTTDTF